MMINIPYDFQGTVEYQSYSEIEDRIKNFDRLYNIGKDESGTYNMYLIELGTKGKPVIFLGSSMHGTEWHTTQYGLSFLEQLRDDSFPDKQFRNFLLSNFCLVYIPVINPYGLDRLTDEYNQFDNTARYNVNGIELNGDFYEFTQQESRNVASQIEIYKPFAAIDMHMFQPEYNVGYGRDLILANGQSATDNIRTVFRDSWSSYVNREVTVWTNELSPTSGVLRAYVARHNNPHTPHTLSYITEIVRPAKINDTLVTNLTKNQIYQFGIAALYIFLKTSIDYFTENQEYSRRRNRPLYVRDLSGVEYPAQLTYTWDGELNGNQSVSTKILPSKTNLRFINNIAELWIFVDGDGVEYNIVYCKRQGVGNSMTVDIKAVPLFFDTFNTQRIYDRYDRHMTANAFFSLVFEGSGFSFILNGTFEAIQWEGLGEGNTRLDMLKNGLNRYKAEFRIVGSTVYIENQIGIDSQFRYEHRLNASNIVQEIDANEFHTYAKGYGDYGDGQGGGDWQDAKLIREYTSPLADVIGIREAPPIKNGNITTTSTMDSQLKTLVDESLKISVSATIHDLRKQGYQIAQSSLGDRVFLIDKRIGFDEEVRVVNKSVTYDWKGDIVDMSLTFGTPGLSKRYQSNLNSATKNITQLLEGNLQLPFSVVDERIKSMTYALQNVLTELTVPQNGGLMAVDKDNPNNLVLFNAAGIGVSSDGGATFPQAITGEGVNASVITSGKMLADRIAGGILQSLNGRTEWNMNTGDMYSRNTNWTFGTGAQINFESNNNKMTYRKYDEESGFSRSAGIGFGDAIGGRYPFTYLGTNGSSNLDTLNQFFSGLIVNTTARIAEGGANSINGKRVEFRDEAIGWKKGLVFDWFNTPTISPMSHNTHDIGTWNYRFRRVYADNILGYPTVFFTNPTANRGFLMDTDYRDGKNPTFRGQYPADNFYNLGEETAPFSYTYTTTIYRKYENELSSYNAKMNIEDIDMDLAEMYVDDTSVKSFHYKNQYEENDYVNPYSLRSGVIIEQLEEGLEYFVKGDKNSIDATSIQYILQAVLKKTRQEFKSYKEDTDLIISLLIEDVENLKGGTLDGTA